MSLWRDSPRNGRWKSSAWKVQGLILRLWLQVNRPPMSRLAWASAKMPRSDSTMLKGIRLHDTQAITYSILMRAKHHTIRYIKTVHNLDMKMVRLRSDAQDHML